MRPSRRHARVFFVAVLLVSAGAIASSYATAERNLAERQDTDRPPTGFGVPASDPVADAGGTPDSGPATETVARADGDVSDGAPGPETWRTNATTVDPSRHAAENLTVVATQGFYVSDERGELVAFDEDGDVAFYDASHRVYFDVDPVADERYTVEYLTSRHFDGEDCANVSTPRCTYNVFNRVNLTTGEHEEVYGELTPRIYSARWHDADRINDTHVAVADIVEDSVRIVDVRTDETVWRWHASSLYDRDQGGQEGDWTHVNDVEVLPDGRLMASIRNMDQVVFIEPGEGVDERWTLGEDDNYDVLHEQHNPDYIPADRGGPAVTVADSENTRVLEYQRVAIENGSASDAAVTARNESAADAEWRRSWGWRDSRLQWPRDADRLPNGNTLVSDTHGDRVAEVAPNGSTVWSVTVGMPYEAERLGTGDESTGGYSMEAIRGGALEGAENGQSGPDPSSDAVPGRDDNESGADADAPPGSITHPDRGPVERFWLALKGLTPSLAINGLLFASPSWIRFTDLVFGFVLVLGSLSWLGAEAYWSRYDVSGYLRSIPRRVRPEFV